MYKYILLIITFIFLTQCSLDTKTGFWTKSKIPKEKKDDLEEIFKPAEILEKEFNTNVRIKINSSYSNLLDITLLLFYYFFTTLNSYEKIEPCNLFSFFLFFFNLINICSYSIDPVIENFRNFSKESFN